MSTTSVTESELRVAGISKEFATAEASLEVLRGVDLVMKRGDAVVITGPSGSGKSTLLYIIGTLDEPTSGTVCLEGEDPFSLPESARARFRNRNIGFVFQDHHLLPQCTVLENVLVPLLADAGVGSDDVHHAEELLKRVGLGERMTHRPAQLSGGERQRVAVCRALIHQPLLLLADEPTGNLDRQTAESVGSLLLDLCREQNTILICVTHSLELAGRFPRHCQLLDGELEEAERTASEPQHSSSP